MSKKIKTIIGIATVVTIIIGILVVIFNKRTSEELQTISSEKQLLNIYESEKDTKSTWIKNIIGMPFTFLGRIEFDTVFERNRYYGLSDYSIDGIRPNSFEANNDTSTLGKSSTKEYSTTNIQVENVDEADITKTDGDYIYSISDNQVIITNVKTPEKPVIAAKIKSVFSSYPEDLILYNNKLVIISQNGSGSYYSRYSSNQNTLVCVYDITTRENPILLKSYELYEPYYTSRCINNKLYVISSGYLRKENDKIVRAYKEDYREKQIALNNIHYLKEVYTNKQTIFSTLDLDNTQKEIDIRSYLIDISNAFVSENSFYLLDEEYENDYKKPTIKSLFGLGGIIGFFNDIYDYNYNTYDSGYKTKIFKFNIRPDGNIVYATKNKTNGKTINQYSLDEKNGHLRVALHDSNGTRVVIFDEKLNKIGETQNLAKGEKMYSSRFIGNKAYLVTYKTIDPLWVIDLSDERNPEVLGELSIPGYSTYLHTYDETHLRGIGMETKEKTNRDSFGRVTSTTARIVGMKMALFDVSDVKNPRQISSTVIGDSRTTSAILTNPKALLFSKEKQLIAIPVNHYNTDFELTDTTNTYSSVISAYKNKSSNHIGEGYLVYKINLEEGFKLKGLIAHEKANTTNSYNYYYYTSKMLRGLYIENNLYTVSETALKVNNLEDLKLISELKIKGE